MPTGSPRCGSRAGPGRCLADRRESVSVLRDRESRVHDRRGAPEDDGCIGPFALQLHIVSVLLGLFPFERNSPEASQ